MSESQFLPPPAISVLMPLRNNRHFVRSAIDSVLQQTVATWELIVIDDHSSDDGRRIVQSLMDCDSRITLMTSDGVGVARALNTGLAYARGKYLARLDSDDVALPSRFRLQMDFLDKHDEVVVLGGSADVIDANDVTIGLYQRPTRQQGLANSMLTFNGLIHSTTMARTEVVKKLGGYRLQFEAAEDYDLWLRAGEYGELENLPIVLGSYRVHAAQTSKTRAGAQGLASFLVRMANSARMNSQSEEMWVNGDLVDRIMKLDRVQMRALLSELEVI